ncbi:MAG: EI24 domain-containing protein [Flavobacteriales bacterium]
MEQFFNEFWLGIRTYPDAVKLIVRKKLWAWFIPPLVLSILILLGAWWLELHLKEQSIPNVNSIKGLMADLFYNLFVFSVIMMGYKLRKYIVFIVLSPMLTKLSLKTETIITGNTYESNWKQFMSDIRRAIRISMGNFILEYSIFALWYVFVLFVADAKPLTSFFLFSVGCYFYGFCMIDYINERFRLSIDDSVKFVRTHAGFAIGNGAVFSLMFFIPYDIGVVFAPVLAVIAATLGMHEITDLSKNPFALKKSAL